MFATLYRLADFARHHGRARCWEQDQATGRRGEDIAHRHLQRVGMTVVARNHRTPGGAGEVDLIAWDRDSLVFVEVKCRGSADYGPPDRAIDERKQRKIVYAARDYALRANVPWEQARFDVVNVVLLTPPEVTHLKDVFTQANPAYV